MTQVGLRVQREGCVRNSQRHIGVHISECTCDTDFSGYIVLYRPAGNDRGQVSRGQFLNRERSVQRHSVQIFDLAGKLQLRMRRDNGNVRYVDGQLVQTSVYRCRSDNVQRRKRRRSNSDCKSVEHGMQPLTLQSSMGLKGHIVQAIRRRCGPVG